MYHEEELECSDFEGGFLQFVYGASILISMASSAIRYERLRDKQHVHLKECLRMTARLDVAMGGVWFTGACKSEPMCILEVEAIAH